VSSLLHSQERRDARVILKTKPSVVKCMHGQKMKKDHGLPPTEEESITRVSSSSSAASDYY
jgi:hypothetical protein